MIAVDTSALMAIVLGEAEADACIAILEAETVVLISVGARAEALIVAGRRMGIAISHERIPLQDLRGGQAAPPWSRLYAVRDCCRAALAPWDRSR